MLGNRLDTIKQRFYFGWLLVPVVILVGLVLVFGSW